MSDLFSNLRSLLPHDYVRGTSSIFDDLEDATKYIKDLEKSIKELEGKRDKLKESLSQENQDEVIGSSSSSTSNDDRSIIDDYVHIHTFPRRLEIEISVKAGKEDMFSVSKVLKQVLLEEGLDIVSCLSSKVNERWKCVIHCDMVNDEHSLDSSRLQGRLASEISSYVS